MKPETINKVKKFFQIHDLCKTVNRYEDANKIFKYLYMSLMNEMEKIEIETYGRNSSAHFDLLVLHFEGLSANMPIELFGWKRAYAILKKYPTIKRLEHNRVNREASEVETELIDKFFKSNGKAIDKMLARMVYNDL